MTKYKVNFDKRAKEEYTYWKEKKPENAERIKALIKDIKRSHFKGLGKPEALKHDMQGYWSREITTEHRLVYRIRVMVENDEKYTEIIIASCRYHYKKHRK